MTLHWENSLLFIVALFALTQAFEAPNSIDNIALGATVTTADTCTTGNPSDCDHTCPTRKNLPVVFKNPFDELKSLCPNFFFTANSEIHLRASVGSDNSCTTFNVSGLENKFSFSVWVNFTCQTCDVMNVSVAGSPILTLAINADTLTVSDTQENSDIQVPSFEWFLLTLQVSTRLSVFINESRKFREVVNIQDSPDISIQLGKSAGSGEDITFKSLKVYNDVLTDRDIEELTTASPPTSGKVMPTCRCPPDYPEFDPSANISKQCTNGSSHVSRFNPKSHIIEFINDGNTETSWISKSTNSATITIELGNVFEIEEIRIDPFTSSNLVVDLQRNGGSSTKKEFSTSCGQGPCEQLNTVGNIFSWAIDDHTQSRTEYEKNLADVIQLTFTGDPSNFFKVKEVTVKGRCSCYGNAKTCSVKEEDGIKSYTCDCLSNTSTSGNDCSSCLPNKYHLMEGFGCTETCSCEKDNVKNENDMCKEAGGECLCKDNVEGSRCTQCKHFTYGLSPTKTAGCDLCGCDMNGTVTCDTGNGICVCKDHVSDKANNCEFCEDYYYGRHLPDGCQSCGCNKYGTDADQCNGELGLCKCREETGQCTCKTNVMGRQCDTCKDEFWKLSHYPNGCDPCDCNVIGSVSQNCDKQTGQCPCEGNLKTDQKCKPQKISVFPEIGPKAGGTKVTVTGILIGGSSIGVDVIFELNGEHRKLDSNTSLTKIIFETLPDSSSSVPYEVVLYRSGVHFKIANGTFTYGKNPEVSSAPRQKSFFGGGCALTIEGTDFKTVADPVLIGYREDTTESYGECVHFGESKLVCRTPTIPKTTGMTSVQYGLKFDGWDKYMNLTSNFPEAVLEYVNDPTIHPEDDSISFRYPFIKTITIKGNRFLEACAENDYKVSIGGKTCPIDRMSDTEIVCIPDAKFPGTDKVEELQLIIGHRTVKIGKVEFVMFWKSEEFIYICVGAGGLVLIILIICIVCCCCRRGRCRQRKQTGKRQSNGDPELPLVPQAIVEPIITEVNFVEKFFSKIDPGLHKQLRLSLIDRKQIEPGNVCSLKGNNTRRTDGMFKAGTSNFLAGKKLHIKTLREAYPLEESSGLYPKWLSAGLSDYIRMRDFEHENVMKFYGFAVDDKRFYLLYPIMENRTLKEHLVDSTKELFMGDLVGICLSVVKGMKYLSQQQFVHKDLAARNCMVDSNNNIRISDSSFSWDLFSEEYLYDMDRNRWRPVRWMATESLKMGFYDTKSDVWSFGVLMWEVMTRGCLPYQEKDRNEAVPDYVMRGYRLGQPENLCDMCFECMLSCWDEDSSKRPSFSSLLDNMTQLIETMMADNSEPDNSDTGMYINAPNIQPELPPELPPRSPQNGLYSNVNYGFQM